MRAQASICNIRQTKGDSGTLSWSRLFYKTRKLKRLRAALLVHIDRGNII